MLAFRRRSRPSWSWQKLLTQCPNICAMLLTLHSKLSSKFTSYYSSELLVLQREEFNLLQKAKCYPFGPYNSALHFLNFHIKIVEINFWYLTFNACDDNVEMILVFQVTSKAFHQTVEWTLFVRSCYVIIVIMILK